MDVRCERCRAQYVFDDDQVTPSGLTVQCTNCGHLFKVKKKELVVTVAVKPGDFEGEPLPATAAAPRSGGARASLPGGAPAAAAPLTIEMKAAEPPAPPPPVPAPEPVVEAGVQGPPEPVKPAERPAPKGPKALLAQARKLLEKGDPDAALELFGRVASQDPRNAEALTGRGLCYLDLEKYATAEASFSAALQSDPEDPDAMLGLAETYRFQGKQIEAIAHYEKYLARHPDGEEAEVARNALA